MVLTIDWAWLLSQLQLPPPPPKYFQCPPVFRLDKVTEKCSRRFAAAISDRFVALYNLMTLLQVPSSVSHLMQLMILLENSQGQGAISSRRGHWRPQMHVVWLD